MTKTHTTRRRNYSPRPATRRSTAASRAKRAAHQAREDFQALAETAAGRGDSHPLPAGSCARVYIHYSVRDHVYPNIYDVPQCRVALVLGAGVRPDGSLSPSLKSRVDTAVELWREGRVEKLLMSGDNRVVRYNEPERMRQYAIGRGVSRDAIVLDHAGRRTYDSIYRARYIFGLKKMIVVTQSFHIDRAIFLCDHLGVQAYGVGSNTSGDLKASIREVPACLGALADVYIRHPLPVMGKKEAI